MPARRREAEEEEDESMMAIWMGRKLRGTEKSKMKNKKKKLLQGDIAGPDSVSSVSRSFWHH